MMRRYERSPKRGHKILIFRAKVKILVVKFQNTLAKCKVGNLERLLIAESWLVVSIFVLQITVLFMISFAIAGSNIPIAIFHACFFECCPIRLCTVRTTSAC